MILESLVKYYEILLERGLVLPMGWSNVGVTYVLVISEEGKLLDISDVRRTTVDGRILPRDYIVPFPTLRRHKIKARFLADDSRYLLGLEWMDDSLTEEKKQKKRDLAIECFEASEALHEEILADIDTPCSKALLGFFRSWNCDSSFFDSYTKVNLKLLLTTANIVFRCPEGFIHDDPAIRKAWDEYYASHMMIGKEGICSVTGERTVIEMVHPTIKMKGAISTGAALVSFNEPAFCSYGKVQGENASVGKYAAFAYAMALNYLLNSDDHTLYIGSMALVFWAEDPSSVYQDLFSFSLYSSDRKYRGKDLFTMLSRICNGYPVLFNGEKINPGIKFHILGLTPNKGRIAVKLYLKNTFGSIIENVMAHHERLKIVCEPWNEGKPITVWDVMYETVDKDNRNDKPREDVACSLIKAMIMGIEYPVFLMNSILIRSKAERDINHIKAAMLKAFYLKKKYKGFDYPEEVLTVSLCRESRNEAYNLGRLLSVLDRIQQIAMPNVQFSVKDKFWGGMMTTPATVFPIVLKLIQPYINRLSDSNRIYFDNMIMEIMNKFGESLPSRLAVAEQGAFVLGYYHQYDFFFSQKERVHDEERCY